MGMFSVANYAELFASRGLIQTFLINTFGLPLVPFPQRVMRPVLSATKIPRVLPSFPGAVSPAVDQINRFFFPPIPPPHRTGHLVTLQSGICVGIHPQSLIKLGNFMRMKQGEERISVYERTRSPTITE